MDSRVTMKADLRVSSFINMHPIGTFNAPSTFTRHQACTNYKADRFLITVTCSAPVWQSQWSPQRTVVPLPHAMMMCQGGFPVRPWCLPRILVHRTLILLLPIDRLSTECLNSHCQNHPLLITAASAAPELISQALIFLYNELQALESSAPQNIRNRRVGIQCFFRACPPLQYAESYPSQRWQLSGDHERDCFYGRSCRPPAGIETRPQPEGSSSCAYPCSMKRSISQRQSPLDALLRRPRLYRHTQGVGKLDCNCVRGRC